MGNFFLVVNKAYLLDSNREADLPIPIFKSFSQLIEENLFLIVLSIFIIITVLFFILLLRKKKNGESSEKESEIIDPYEDALSNIQSLQDQKPVLSAKPFVFRLSEILRIYVERVFKVPAMELTLSLIHI